MLYSAQRIQLQSRLSFGFVLAAGVLPLCLLFVLRLHPTLDPHLENHWFHFQIVTFTSLVAFVLGLSVLALTSSDANLSALFITLGLGAISGIFLIHGLATPGVLTLSVSHEEHEIVYQAFARPDLVVVWSAPISLVVGAVFFALSALKWPSQVEALLLTRRRPLLTAVGLAYLAYVLTAIAYPAPFQLLSNLVPTTRYLLAGSAGVLYMGAAWRFWVVSLVRDRFFYRALTVAALLLGEALLPMTLAPIWTLSWWLYHVLMLAAFCIALGAVILEYERARHFQLTTYFTATSVIVTVLLALLAGELATRLLGARIEPQELGVVRWSVSAIFAGMAGLLFIVLFQVVRRGDKLLSERARELQRQQAALERGRMAEALVPIGVAMGKSLDLERVLDMICRESLRLFDVDTTILWFREGEELVVRAAAGNSRAEFLGMRQPVNDPELLGARVVRERRPLFVNQAQQAEGVKRALVKQFNVRAILGVPLLSENEVVGALVLIETRNPDRFGALDLDVARIFGQQAAMVLTHARLYDRIQQQARALAEALSQLRSSYGATLMALSAALDARDNETQGHSQRVTAYALLLAEEMGIRDPAMREALEWGALLHDVGKIGIPDAILCKPSRLSAEEWAMMRRHPEIGGQILQGIPFLRPALAIVLNHHEQWNGAGYPRGFRGEEIPLLARIFAVADAWDAMTHDRPYRPARTFAEARSEIQRQRGNQFDPAVVDAFLRIPEERWHEVGRQIPACTTTRPFSSPENPTADGRPDAPTHTRDSMGNMRVGASPPTALLKMDFGK